MIKMATGSGKTKVMTLALAWSYFHKLYEADSQLARNFLVIAPNIIVLDRIYKDFQGLRISLTTLYCLIMVMTVTTGVMIFS